MMKTWFRDRRDIVLRNFGTKLWNSFKVRVILVLLDGEVVGTSRIRYKKRNFQKHCAKELTRCKQTERFYMEPDCNHFSLFYILAFVLIHFSFTHPSVHSFILIRYDLLLHSRFSKLPLFNMDSSSNLRVHVFVPTSKPQVKPFVNSLI